MAIQIGFTLVETADDCESAGPVCFMCPQYDVCEHAYDEEGEQ